MYCLRVTGTTFTTVSTVINPCALRVMVYTRSVCVSACLSVCVCVCPAPRVLPLRATERPTEGTYGFGAIWETFLKWRLL